MTKTYLLPEELKNALLSYLYDRPYKEVGAGVRMLEGLLEAPAGPPTSPALALVETAASVKAE